MSRDEQVVGLMYGEKQVRTSRYRSEGGWGSEDIVCKSIILNSIVSNFLRILNQIKHTLLRLSARTSYAQYSSQQQQQQEQQQHYLLGKSTKLIPTMFPFSKLLLRSLC